VIDSAANDGRKRGKLGAIEQPPPFPGINSVLLLLLLLSWKLDYSVRLRHAMAGRLSFLLYFFTFKRKFGGEKRVYFHFCCISKKKRSVLLTRVRREFNYFYL
jgi:hypothetical protein